MIPTFHEMLKMTPEQFAQEIKEVSSFSWADSSAREEAWKFLQRQKEAMIRRFELPRSVIAAHLGRFCQVSVTIPSSWENLDWVTGDPRILKVEEDKWDGREDWLWVTLNGHTEWSNQQVVDAEMAERRRVDAPAKNKY